MSPRTGRPTEDPRKNQTKVRMTDRELEKLEICCEKTGLNKTEVICKGIDLVYKEVTEK